MKNEFWKIIEFYGVNHQQRKLMEELFELQEAIIVQEKCRDLEPKHVIEELADVMVLLKQFQVLYGIDDKEIEEVMQYKINRQIGRINND